MNRRTLNTRTPSGLLLTGMALGMATAVTLFVGRALLRPGLPFPPVRGPSAGMTPTPPPTPLPPELAGAYAELQGRRLELPVESPSHVLADSFLDERANHVHHAIDIFAPRNTPVRAVDDGTILQLSSSPMGGISIYQADARQRFCFFYAHLQGYAAGLHDGQSVARGDAIGYVGTTGNAPPGAPHLHFAIYVLEDPRRCGSGTPINPFPLLRPPG